MSTQGELALTIHVGLNRWTDVWVSDSSTHTAHIYWGSLWRQMFFLLCE